MKKIGVLTFHNACNYGAFLQALSLYKTLDSYDGVEAGIVNYHCPAIEEHYSVKGVFKTRNAKKLLLKMVRLHSIVKRNRLFREAREKNFRLWEFDKASAKDYFRFVTGSDQIWNLSLTGGDKGYFLDFAKSEQKTSYAASVGKVGSAEQIHEIGRLVSDFHAVAVRERALFDAMKNEPCRDLTLTLDPVFLTAREKWLEFAGKEPAVKERYILVFIMGVSKQGDHLVRLAKKLASERKCKVILVGDQERWYKYRDVTHFGVASPSQFVNLISNADLVLTNSFHATSFSIIMQSDFLSECNIGSPERVTTLLEITGLSSHRIFDGKPKFGEPQPIDWSDVSARLSKEVKSSKEFIEKHIIEG